MSAATVLSAEGLTRVFDGGFGVRDVSIAIGPGEIFGFLGPNGAGKSTTIRLLLGLYRRSAGTVDIAGLDPDRDAVAIHRMVGYLPGELALYPRLTGRAHLDRFASARGLTDTRWRDELAERFTAELDRPVRTLSKGNRQKIGIIAAFMHRPDILILDEPTSGLDPLLQDEFAKLLREVASEGATVFLSSHELDEVQRLADRVAIIRTGSVVVTDSVDGLRNRSPRTVAFRFDQPVDARRFDGLPGVRVIDGDPAWTTLSVTASVADVLRIAAELQPVDISARQADLDELFLSYYRAEPDAR